jgi:hypothetical protein
VVIPSVYPSGFNQRKFESFKTELAKQASQPSAQLARATLARISFYVIVVTRQSKTKLTNETITNLWRMLGDLLNAGESLESSYTRARLTARTRGNFQITSNNEEDRKNIHNSLGIVIFNEYFFPGKNLFRKLPRKQE